jgi:hypothetical protein
VPWAADFRTACGLAAEQHRLVLLHFTTDNCPPCRKVEQEVFSQTEVGQAIGQNYVPVLVHAVRNPELATRYQVKHFPTDLIVTPSGLEIYRVISPQKPADYIAMLHRVAGQTGVGSSRNWSATMGSTLQQAASDATTQAQQAASALNQSAQQSAAAAQGAAGQAAAGLQDQAALAHQRWSQAVQQFATASDQARSTAQQATGQAASAGRELQHQVVGAADEMHQRATVAANSAEQQIAGTTQQFQQQSAAAIQHGQQQVRDWRQQLQASGQVSAAAARGAAQQSADAARSTAQTWQQSLNTMKTDLRSSFVPGGVLPVPAGVAPVPGSASPQAPPPTPAGPAASPAPDPVPAAAAPPLAPQPPLMPTENPWFGAARRAPAASAAPPPTQSPQQPAPPAGANASRQTVAASQAPPLAIDGYCVVTLLESFLWKKANPRYGAIHRGRTYLFVGEAEQQRFLVNPDAYAPVLSGCDPVRFSRTGELVPGKRAYGLLTPDKRIFLFADLNAMEQFQRSPGEFAAAAYQAMQRNDTGTQYR